MKSFPFSIILCFCFSFIQAQPFKSYVNLQNTVFNLPFKLGWSNGDPVFRDEFDSLYVDTLYRDKIVTNGVTTYVPNKNFYLINGKWRWFWATHTWTDQAVYFKFENCVINDTNIADPANPSNKYMSMFVKHHPDNDLVSDEPFHPGENPMFPMKTNYSASMLINGTTHNPDYWLDTVHQPKYLFKGNEFLYGFFEVRARIPKARYTWPGFWLRGEHEEIDGTELGGNDQIVMSMHNDAAPKSTSAKFATALPGQTFGGNWVTYAIKWERNKVIWYINNKPVRITRDLDFRKWTDDSGEHIMPLTIPSHKMGLILNNFLVLL